jgi:hypothetical protein
MIVLDEQLLGYGLQTEIAAWYRGAVIDVTALRPNTVITDDEIPALLRTVRRPTFVTINVVDFWRRLRADSAFCAVCFELSHRHAAQISPLLRNLLRLAPFHIRAGRMGKVARVRPTKIEYYTHADPTIRRIDWA